MPNAIVSYPHLRGLVASRFRPYLCGPEDSWRSKDRRSPLTVQRPQINDARRAVGVGREAFSPRVVAPRSEGKCHGCR